MKKNAESRYQPRGSTLVDRVDAYVDSPLMSHRVSFERRLFARIQGNCGICRTWVRRGSRGLDSGCSCPSDWLKARDSTLALDLVRAKAYFIPAVKVVLIMEETEQAGLTMLADEFTRRG